MTSAATVKQRPQTGVKPGSSFVQDGLFLALVVAAIWYGMLRAVVLSPRLVVVEEAAAIGKALSPLSVLSRSPLDHVVGVEELLLGVVGASLARLRDFGGSRPQRECGASSVQEWRPRFPFERIFAVNVRVLVVEDEENLASLLRKYLEREGFEVHETHDGREALEVARRAEPDVVVLDWMLPSLDGMEVLRELRRSSEAYVIMLTARAAEVDRIVGLSTGADDYLVKPFSPGELVARVRAMLRRPRGATSSAQGILEEEAPISFGELTVDPAQREVRLLGEEVSLTALEFDLLAALASRPGFVFSRSRLLERVWGENYFGSDHVVDVHVANLRKKLKDDPSDPRYVQTVRGVGYRFRRP